MEEGRVGAYGERKIRVCPQRRPRNASGHRARRNQRPKGWRRSIASWRFQPNPFVKWSRVSRSKVERLSDLVGIHWAVFSLVPESNMLMRSKTSGIVLLHLYQGIGLLRMYLFHQMHATVI